MAQAEKFILLLSLLLSKLNLLFVLCLLTMAQTDILQIFSYFLVMLLQFNSLIIIIITLTITKSRIQTLINNIS